jgi:hypothetical protein
MAPAPMIRALWRMTAGVIALAVELAGILWAAGFLDGARMLAAAGRLWDRSAAAAAAGRAEYRASLARQSGELGGELRTLLVRGADGPKSHRQT